MRALSIVAIIALIVQSGMLFLALFEPPLAYNVPRQPLPDNRDPVFLTALASITGAGVTRNNRVTVLTNGSEFYRGELEAIRAARRFVHVECYIFQKGEVSDMFIDALAERARSGVRVRLLADAIGSTSVTKETFRKITDAGGLVAFYHPVRWYTWPRLNNRTHRELIVVDGEVGFAGGAGFADHWYKEVDGDPAWRDMMLRFDGDAASGLSAVFAENWLESKGEVLFDPSLFPLRGGTGRTTAMVVGSAPTTGRSTYARVLLQSMAATARTSIDITTPYFLPDPSLRAELAQAIRDRGVKVRVIVPGHKSDHTLTRTSSRRLYGTLLEAGAAIYEYQPSMNHTKCMVVDGLWSVVGSTNIDSRSFGLNDELNVAMNDPDVAARLTADFERDLRQSHRVSYEEWKKRPLWQRVQEILGSIVERQQ